MNNVVTLKIPVELMEKAIRIAAKSKAEQGKIDDERKVKYLNKTKEEIRKYAGEEGVQQFQRDIADFNERKRQIAQKAQDEIKAIYEQAVSFIDDEATPKGSDVAGEDDFLLLDHNVVDAEQLERLIDKHSNNYAFRIAAARYAKRQGWDNADSFACITKEKAIRAYCEQVFERLAYAAAHPASPVNMQYVETENEYFRISKAYGLEAEYLASGGERLNKVIKDLF